jgi:capsular polysaccharide export protein
MTPAGVQPLLRVPPFPGSRPLPFFERAREPVERTDSEWAEVIGMMAQNRVGGTYWAAQPPLPRSSYALVRVRSENERVEVAAEISKNTAVLAWADSTPRRPVPPAVSLVTGPCDPWHLLGGASEVIADADDDIAILAAIAGLPVRCVGEGRCSALGSGAIDRSHLIEVFRREASRFEYRDPFTGDMLSLPQAAELCAFWRAMIDRNRDLAAAIGFAFWKRGTVAPLLWGGSSPVPFRSGTIALPPNGKVAVWKSRTPANVLNQLISKDAAIIEVEDGFIRSSGLGADCVPPLSIVVDRAGIYFDPGRPSDLEQIIEGGPFPPDLLDRASRLRSLIVESGISKYGASSASTQRRCQHRLHILAVGQVEDDRAVQCGGGPRTNLELLTKVRQGAPDAYIIYKPHPDVEAGHRAGAIPMAQCLELADEIAIEQPISPLISMVDEVHVNTSLAGFEALLRGKRVTAHGVPFYAGWGLTQDFGPVPARRTARRTLNELVAAVLLVYPRYVDPVTGLPCTAEILIRRLSQGGQPKGGPLVRLRRMQGNLRRLSALVRRR